MYVDIHVYTTPSSFTKISGVEVSRGTSSTRSLVQTSPPCFSTAFTKASTTEPMPPWPCRSAMKPVKPRFMWCICIVKHKKCTTAYTCVVSYPVCIGAWISVDVKCLVFAASAHENKNNETLIVKRKYIYIISGLAPYLFHYKKKTLQNCGNLQDLPSDLCWMLALGYAKPLDPFQCNSSMVKAIAAHVVPVQSRPDNENAKASSHALNLALQKMHHKWPVVIISWDKKRSGSYMNPYDLIRDHCLLEPPTLRATTSQDSCHFMSFCLSEAPTNCLSSSFLPPPVDPTPLRRSRWTVEIVNFYVKKCHFLVNPIQIIYNFLGV